MRFQYGTIVHLTGVPAAGKSTIAEALGHKLFRLACPVEVMDADELRKTFFPELKFSRKDRDENVRRNYELAIRLARHGTTAIMALIAPYEETRMNLRAHVATFRLPLVLVHVDAPRATVEARDPKGLYAKVSRGELKGLTGIDDPYETPVRPDCYLDTSVMNLDECVNRIMDAIVTVRRRWETEEIAREMG